MVQSSGDAADDALDEIFAALADPTRRRVLAALDRGAVSVSELARPHGMSLTGFMKHLRVLEGAGLIARSKEGRVVRCALSAAPLQEAAVWIARYEKFWTSRFDALGRYLYHQEEVHPCPPSPSPPATDRRSQSTAATTPRPSRSGAPGPTRKR